MNTIIIKIDNLTNETVTLLYQNILTVEGETYIVGFPNAVCYMNSDKGREEIKNDVKDIKILNAVFSIWGDVPTQK